MAKFHSVLKWAALGAVCLSAVACNNTPEIAPPAATGIADPKVSQLYQPEAQAGVAIDEATMTKDMPDVRMIAQRRNWDRRSDNFALLASESSFERSQALERVLNEAGGFSMEFTPPEDPVDDGPRVLPTPRWRLAGIVVSEGAVIALLDTGTKVDTIVPGQAVEGTNWVCVSIDEEKAIFRRPGNELPNEIAIPLQGTLPGMEGTGGGGGNTNPGGGDGNPGGGRGGPRGGGEPGGDNFPGGGRG